MPQTKPHPDLREHLDLCDIWKFQPDPAVEGEQAAYFDPGYDDRLWREVRLPCTFEACHPGLDTYEGHGWFRRAITVPAHWQGKRIVLHFAGANYHTIAWINGRAVGESLDGFLPFEFPVQRLVQPGSEAMIAVRVDNLRRAQDVPGLQRGWRTFGGILREVELQATEPFHLDQVATVAEPAQGGGRLSIQARVRNERTHGAVARLTATLTDAEGQALANLTSEPVSCPAGAERELSAAANIADVKPWSPASPTLYTAHIALLVDGQAVDERTIRVGFRTVQIQDGRLLLNGRPIYLTGFNRHEDSPTHAMVTDPETTRQDLTAMKAAGANFVRLCHYPHHSGELDMCDELGMLAMGEVPLYWWQGNEEGAENCRAKLDAAKRQLAAMIRRDINHPSILFWSVSNENDEARPEVVDGNGELVRLARHLDPTRLAVHVSDHWQQHPHFDDDDVMCVNAYPTLSRAMAPNRPRSGGRHDDDLADSTRFWRDGLAALHARYPHKPILITEFGYVALKDVYDGAFGEDAQSRAIAAEFAGMDAPYVCGATIWCWADHPWPQATFAFCRHLGISPYGVLSHERRRKKGYQAARQLFCTRQGIPEQPWSPAPRLGPAGYEVSMIRPNLLDIPQVPLAEGFSIRPMRMDEGGMWSDIERDAELYFPITERTFHSEFDRDLPATQWRSFFIVDHRGVAVGTISAWYDRDHKGQDTGVIHWIAIRPTYQGRGLGKAAMSFALNQLSRWHERAILGTQTKRLRAIGMYLDFGFLPELDHPGFIDVWREVNQQIKHPVLDRVLAEVSAAQSGRING